MFTVLLKYNNYSILIPFVTSLFLYRRVERAYHPFFWLIWLGAIGETTQMLSAILFRTNALAMNVYTVLEACLVIYIFYRWDLFKNGFKTFQWIVGTYLTAFLIENVFVMRPNEFNALGPTLFSSTIALLTIQMINKLIVEGNKPLMKEAAFYVCCAFVIYFTYNALVEIFYFYGLQSIKWIQRTINILLNLLYTVATLWTPRKQDSLLPLSFR